MSYSPPKQLSLGVSLEDDATFDNFYTARRSHNAQVVAALRAQLDATGEPYLFLWGAPGVGLTHLLQAACHQAEAQGLGMQYLPLQELVGFAPEQLLDGLEALDFVCLDGLHWVAGNAVWERALFNLYNRLRDSGKRLLIAAHQSPRELPIALADLQSRLHWGVTFQVHNLSDADKQAALQMRARARGLELSDEVAQFVLHRAPRDMNELFCYLKRLDDASLAEQRKLTIPFVKRTLGI